MHKGYKCLSQEVLKLIACLTMFIDHVGATLIIELPFSFMPTLYYTCRIIGRLAFPIYAFLIVQGVKHTQNEGKYLLRLAIGMVLSELPFDLLFEGGISLAYQSVMVTLLLGAAMLMVQKRLKPLWAKALLILPFAVLAELCRSDYGGMGVVMIAVFGLAENLTIQTVGMALCNILMPSAAIPVLGMQISVQLFAIPAMVFIALYSGRKLLKSKALQWGFYLFYPVHIMFLWGLLQFLR